MPTAVASNHTTFHVFCVRKLEELWRDVAAHRALRPLDTTSASEVGELLTPPTRRVCASDRNPKMVREYRWEGSILRCFCIEAFTHQLSELADRVRLGQEIVPFDKGSILASDARTIATRVNHLQARAFA